MLFLLKGASTIWRKAGHRFFFCFFYKLMPLRGVLVKEFFNVVVISRVFLI